MSRVIVVGIAAIVAVAAAFALVRGGSRESASADAKPPHTEERDRAVPARVREAPAGWAERVARARRWSPPAGNRLPGAGDSPLAASTEEWIATLPVDRQQAAREFVARYPLAYQVESREQMAWLLERGFPSLEELAAFDFVAHTRNCNSLHCGNGKVSSLAADALLQDIIRIVPPEVSRAVEIPDFGATLTPDQLAELAPRLADARNYIDKARDGGSTLFAAYLSARLAEAIGDIDRAEFAYAFIAACGDPRPTEFAQHQLPVVQATLTSSMGGSRACGVQAPTPVFPELRR